MDPERHGTDRRPMELGKGPRKTVLLPIDEKVHAPLAIKRDALGAMPCDGPEPQHLEELTQQSRIRRGVLDEFKTIRAHGIG